MSVSSSPTLPIRAFPPLLSLDTGLLAALWLAIIGQTFHLSFERPAFYALFLLFTGGAVLFNLNRNTYAGTWVNLVTQRIGLLQQERKMLFLLLPLVFLCALILIYLDLPASILWQIWGLSFLFFAYLGLLAWHRNTHQWGFVIPLLKSSLFLFLMAAFLWPVVNSHLWHLSLGLVCLTGQYCMILVREESYLSPHAPPSPESLYLSLLNQNLPLLSLWLLIFLLAAVILSPSLPVAIFFVALSTGAINLFILFQWGKPFPYLSFRYLARLLLALPALPLLLVN